MRIIKTPWDKINFDIRRATEKDAIAISVGSKNKEILCHAKRERNIRPPVACFGSQNVVRMLDLVR